MQGWRTALTPEGLTEFPNEVVALITDETFPDPDLIRETVKSAPENTVWVARYADMVALTTLRELEIDFCLSRPNDYYKATNGNGHRYEEMVNTCSKVLVFRDANATGTEWFAKAAKRTELAPLWGSKLFVIERGKKKSKPKKKGKATHQ